ncbi:hypothetical protein [Desulfuromonas acetoxidans]|uniref:hypothetical protein n=1 Tax=Desulfuromonas acetoxidans TaxID=891 RepID=UPI00292E09DF|nr:hypothetical protein [Desulfuromonas acetoxidans]
MNFSQKLKGNENLQVAGDLNINLISESSTSVQRLLYLLLSCGLIATTVPNTTTNQIACAIVLTCALIIFGIAVWQSDNRVNRRKLAAAAMLVLSLASGCGGPILAQIQDPKLTDLTSEYKSGIAEGFGVFGFGLEDVNIAAAADQGGIEKIHFVDSSRSYGLISYAKITVFGK